MVEGISHLTIIVRDLAKTSRLLVEALGGKEVYSSGNETFSLSKEKFFIVGGTWIAAMEGEPRSGRSYDHIAFKVSPGDLPRYRAAIERLGLDIREARTRIDGEGESLYFHDFDNHLFELHTGTLQDRLAAYAKIVPEPGAAS